MNFKFYFKKIKIKNCYKDARMGCSIRIAYHC
jgi:hypothetical protein